MKRDIITTILDMLGIGGLLVVVLVFSGCATDPQKLLNKLPSTGFSKFQYTRTTGPSSATITAVNAAKDSSGIIADSVEITENFAFGTFYLKIEDYWWEPGNPEAIEIPEKDQKGD